MTTIAWVFAGLTALFAVSDWWATWSRRKDVRYATKPATLAALIAVALTLDPVDPTLRSWMVVGLVLSLAGDVFLMLDEKWFVAGLGSFLLGHIAYVVALQLAPTSLGWMGVGLLVVGGSIAAVAPKIVGGMSSGGQREMVGPVVAYIAVISAMVVSAFGTASVWAVVGAMFFYVSDGTLAYNRFIKERPLGPLAVMVTYHLGQAGLVAWLV